MSSKDDGRAPSHTPPDEANSPDRDYSAPILLGEASAEGHSPSVKRLITGGRNWIEVHGSTENFEVLPGVGDTLYEVRRRA